MKLNTKILVLIILFGIQSAMYFVNGVLEYLEGTSYGEYGNTFIQAGIMGYLAYVIYSTRTWWAYWFALFFVGLNILRFTMGIGFIAYSEIIPSAGQAILVAFSVLTFGIVPLILLLNKELRAAYLSPKI